MLIVVAVAMLRAAMLMLVAALMLIAMSHLQGDQDRNSDDAAKHASERKDQEEEEDEVSMCMHVYAFVCICMLAAVLMVTVMSRRSLGVRLGHRKAAATKKPKKPKKKR
jgi:ABC-type Fe3+ transport system permease subunit